MNAIYNKTMNRKFLTFHENCWMPFTIKTKMISCQGQPKNLAQYVASTTKKTSKITNAWRLEVSHEAKTLETLVFLTLWITIMNIWNMGGQNSLFKIAAKQYLGQLIMRKGGCAFSYRARKQCLGWLMMLKGALY